MRLTRLSHHTQAEFMAEHSNEFDIIITDSSDPIGRDGGRNVCMVEMVVNMFVW